MDRLIAACGLDCAHCPAYVATMANDAAALKKVAEDWGRQFGFAPDADKVRCHGCLATDGLQIGHCAECEIRLCALGKGYATCAACPDFLGAKAEAFVAQVPEARANLESLRRPAR